MRKLLYIRKFIKYISIAVTLDWVVNLDTHFSRWRKLIFVINKNCMYNHVVFKGCNRVLISVYIKIDSLIKENRCPKSPCLTVAVFSFHKTYTYSVYMVLLTMKSNLYCTNLSWHRECLIFNQNEFIFESGFNHFNECKIIFCSPVGVWR